MSADVMRVEEWQAYCHECGWWGPRAETEADADFHADDHDHQNHGGDR